MPLLVFAECQFPPLANISREERFFEWKWEMEGYSVGTRNRATAWRREAAKSRGSGRDGRAMSIILLPSNSAKKLDVGLEGKEEEEEVR